MPVSRPSVQRPITCLSPKVTCAIDWNWMVFDAFGDRANDDTATATAVTTARMAIVLYWREERHGALEDHAADLLHRRRARVATSTSCASQRANSTAASPVTGTIHTNVHRRLLPPANGESRHCRGHTKGGAEHLRQSGQVYRAIR